ncbi:MAG: hypothetical protein WD557_11465 [Dehalococcoidia bacterium]
MSAIAPEETPAAANEGAERTIAVSIETLAWIAVGAIFLGIRLWPIWQMPVGGAELVHLSGAWNASIGVEDDRYVPTLFQALTALSFAFTTSEVPARLLAFLATATIPLALFMLRPLLGTGGALIALGILAFDAVGVVAGVGAGAMGFDLAIAAWLFVLLTRADVPPWAWAAAAFAVTTGGPIALPLVVAAAATTLLRAERPPWRSLTWPAAGIVAGIALTTLRPGLGPDGLTIAPTALFVDGFEQRWSTADGLGLFILASWPVVVGGLLAAAWRVYDAWRLNELDRDEMLLLLWTAFALGWFVTALPSHDPTPLAALALPSALLLGPGLVRGFAAVRDADWTYTQYLIPFAAIALSIAVFYVGDWAKLDRVGNTSDKLVVTGLMLATLAALAVALLDRWSAPTVLTLLVPLAAVPLVVATATIAFRAGDAPLPSPLSPVQARELRDIALQSVGDDGGSIVIHPDFDDALTWPFRDSGTVVVASRIPEDAGFVLWPGEGAPPDGFAPLEGDWALLHEVDSPATGFLKFMRWYTDRYSLAITSEPVAVYVRENE